MATSSTARVRHKSGDGKNPLIRLTPAPDWITRTGGPDPDRSGPGGLPDPDAAQIVGCGHTADWKGDLYLATRHFAASYMVNELQMPAEDVAIALGHTDGGELVRRLYGHRDVDKALDRVVAAFERPEFDGQT